MVDRRKHVHCPLFGDPSNVAIDGVLLHVGLLGKKSGEHPLARIPDSVRLAADWQMRRSGRSMVGPSVSMQTPLTRPLSNQFISSMSRATSLTWQSSSLNSRIARNSPVRQFPGTQLKGAESKLRTGPVPPCFVTTVKTLWSPFSHMRRREGITSR
jgi:hypothetical protein